MRRRGGYEYPGRQMPNNNGLCHRCKPALCRHEKCRGFVIPASWKERLCGIHATNSDKPGQKRNNTEPVVPSNRTRGFAKRNRKSPVGLSKILCSVKFCSSLSSVERLSGNDSGPFCKRYATWYDSSNGPGVRCHLQSSENGCFDST